MAQHVHLDEALKVVRKAGQTSKSLDAQKAGLHFKAAREAGLSAYRAGCGRWMTRPRI
jgi:hypothetical protein